MIYTMFIQYFTHLLCHPSYDITELIRILMTTVCNTFSTEMNLKLIKNDKEFVLLLCIKSNSLLSENCCYHDLSLTYSNMTKIIITVNVHLVFAQCT